MTKKKAPVKKRRTKAQIAATKKLVALNKKRAKTSTKKRVASKKPMRRNTRRYVIKLVPTPAGISKGAPKTPGFWTGDAWDTDSKKAATYRNPKALKGAANLIPRDQRGGQYYTVIGEPL